jgi:single-strand DNA-binding protein
MAGETLLTVVGNLTADPELRYTPSGAAVTSFTVAATPRLYDRDSQEWRDGETLFMRCSGPWRDQAEHAAGSLSKGDRVVVQGTLHQRSYETPEGEKRYVIELDVQEVAVSVKYVAVKILRPARQSEADKDAARTASKPASEPASAAA